MKKKGFTLIELLAVLVILAILALITIPIVLTIISNARENSYKRSIESYGRAVETAVMEYQMNSDGELLNKISDYEQLGYIKTSGNSVNCDLEESTLNNGKLVLRYCQVNNSKYYKYENSNVVEEILYDEYNIGQHFYIDDRNEQYYVIADSDKTKDYVVAMKYNSLSVDEINTYGSGHINNFTQDHVNDAEDGSYHGLVAYYSSEKCGYVNGELIDEECDVSYDESDVKYIVDSWAQSTFSNNELKEVNGYKARLIKKSEYDLLPSSWRGATGIYSCHRCWKWAYTTDSYNSINYYGTPSHLAPYYRGAVQPIVNVRKNVIRK